MTIARSEVPAPPVMPTGIAGPVRSDNGRHYFRVHGPHGWHIMWQLPGEADWEHRQRAETYLAQLTHLTPHDTNH